MTDFDVGKTLINLFSPRNNDDSKKPEPVPLSEFNNDQSFFYKSAFNINSDTDTDNNQYLNDLSASDKIKQLNKFIKTQNYMCNNKLKYLDHILSEPSDSSASDSDDMMSYNMKSNTNKNTISNIQNKYKIHYNKVTYNDVKKQINKYYKLDFSQRYSSALDILASYLKGQKIIYMEACNYTLFRLYLLMIPAIAITAFCTVAQTPLECETNGKYILAGLNGFLTFLLSLISFMKLDASAQAYKITAHQYEKLQTSTEFHSGKLLLFHNNYCTYYVIQAYMIQDTNNYRPAYYPTALKNNRN